jgi:hypothetical protein
MAVIQRKRFGAENPELSLTNRVVHRIMEREKTLHFIESVRQWYRKRKKKMGVNYNQTCILGWAFERNDVEREVRPAEYEQQARYNTKTGEVSHYDNVLVKARDYVLELAGEKADCLWELSEAVASKFDLQCAMDHDEDTFYIGIKLGEKTNYGRADLLNGTVCMVDLAPGINRLRELQEEIAGDDPAIALHFIGSVG